MQTSKQIKDTGWFRVPAVLLKDEALSLSAKVVYCYMLWRYNFFCKNGKGAYFEGQESIASACNLSRKTVNESIQVLHKLGFIYATKNKNQQHAYQVKDVFCLYKNEDGTCNFFSI